MKFVMLNGGSTAGKSTIVDAILREKDNYFKLSYDSLKRLFSKYTPQKDYEKVTSLVFSLAEIVIKNGYNIICDSGLYRERREKVLSLARDAGYDVVEINLEAEYDVLEKRFEERVKNSENAVIKPTNLSKERFRELHEIYHQEKNPEAITLRTDHLSAAEVVSEVMKLI